MKIGKNVLILFGLALAMSAIPSVMADDVNWADNSTNMTINITYCSTERFFIFGINLTDYANANHVENATFETNLTVEGSGLYGLTYDETHVPYYESFSNTSYGIGNLFNITFNQSHFLGAGDFGFRWVGTYSNGTNITTDQWNVSILKGIANVSIYFNGTESNYTYLRGDVANITGTVNVTGKTVTIRYEYYNGTLEGGYAGSSTGNTRKEVSIDTTSFNSSQLSAYNYTVYFGDTNYTLISRSFFPVVTA
jgi:hypothetical protein